MKKRYINSGRGLVLLALSLSGKLKKSVLEADDLHDSRSSDCHNDDRRVTRLGLGNKPLLPT